MSTHVGVLCCFALFVCLTLLASFFLRSHLSLKHVHYLKCGWSIVVGIVVHVYTCTCRLG